MRLNSNSSLSLLIALASDFGPVQGFRLSFNLDVRYIKQSHKTKLNSAQLTDVSISPIPFTVHIFSNAALTEKQYETTLFSIIDSLFIAIHENVYFKI